MKILKGGEWVWNLLQILIFVGALAAIGILGYIYLYEPDYFNKEQHKQIQKEFDDFKDSIAIELKLTKDSLKAREAALESLQKDYKKLNRVSEINTKTIAEQDSLIAIIQRQRKTILNDTITPTQADVWLINKFGG